MTSFILRNIDRALWEAFGARARAEGHTLRWVMLELVRDYIRYGLR